MFFTWTTVDCALRALIFTVEIWFDFQGEAREFIPKTTTLLVCWVIELSIIINLKFVHFHNGHFGPAILCNFNINIVHCHLLARPTGSKKLVNKSTETGLCTYELVAVWPLAIYLVWPCSGLVFIIEMLIDLFSSFIRVNFIIKKLKTINLINDQIGLNRREDTLETCFRHSIQSDHF